MFFRHLMAAGLLLLTSSAWAVPIELTISEIGEKESNNPEDVQCIIFGNSCPGGQQDMSALNYTQGGNQASFDLWADPNAKGSGEAELVNPYTVGYLETFVGRVFGIGIDVNTAGGQPPEILTLFEVWVGGVLAYYFDTPTVLDPNFNGNGFFDFALRTVDLTSFGADAIVEFHAVWDRATDGAENFFVFRDSTQEVPEPATTTLLIGGLTLMGFSFLARRRRRAL